MVIKKTAFKKDIKKHIRQSKNDKFQFYVFNGNSVFSKVTTTSSTSNQSYHIVATRANGTTKIYPNTTKEGEATYTNPSYFILPYTAVGTPHLTAGISMKL